MARIDTINIQGHRDRCVNLTHSVGIGGKNRRQDVLLIQAFFQYFYYDSQSGVMHFLPTVTETMMFGRVESFPITGMMDFTTLQTIISFQQRHNKQLLSMDGAVHPASYSGRTIRSTTEPVMMITLLHLLARKYELRMAGLYGPSPYDYIQALKYFAPGLHI